jgi:O-succinylbenzoic acid--CoA ligase
MSAGGEADRVRRSEADPARRSEADARRGGTTDLVAVVTPRTAAADHVRAAWDAGHAVTVLDPATPRASLTRLLEQLAPTHVIDGAGRQPWPGGEPVDAETAAVVITSGTTGAPKAVELTYAGMETIGHGWAAMIGQEPGDRWLVCVPLHHVAGLAILARASVTGATVIVHDTFDLDAVGTAPRTLGAAVVSVVPTMLARLLDAGAPLHEYRAMVTGGAPIPDCLRERADDAGARVFDAYGQSETWGACVANGVPILGARVRLGVGDEIEIAGAMVMRAYHRDPEATRRAFTPDSWLRTGDIGTFEGERLHVVDRLRDLVISGGVNISPVEVEQVLADHPAVADVAVAGRADAEWGERVVAHVVPSDDARPPTLDELRAFARERLTAPKLPRELVLVDEIPRSSGGKVLRRQLRAEGGTSERD